MITGLCAPLLYTQRAHIPGSIAPQGTLLRFSPSDRYPADQWSEQISNLYQLLLKQIFTAIIVTCFGNVNAARPAKIF